MAIRSAFAVQNRMKNTAEIALFFHLSTTRSGAVCFRLKWTPATLERYVHGG